MKNQSKILLLAAGSLLSLSLSSCSRYYYKPNAVNAPLFTDGGQLHLVAAGSVGEGDGAGKTQFFDLQAAYSPIRHLGIIGNFSTYHFDPYEYDFGEGRVPASAHLGELGVGAYVPVGEGHFKLVVDGYLGGGTGRLESDVDADVHRLFFQPGIGMRSPWVDFAFHLRWSRLYYRNLDDHRRGRDYLFRQGLINDRGRRIDEGGYTFMEPSLTLRTGYRFAKAQFQLALANSMTHTHWDYNSARFTVGFYFELEGLMETIRESNAKP